MQIWCGLRHRKVKVHLTPGLRHTPNPAHIRHNDTSCMLALSCPRQNIGCIYCKTNLLEKHNLTEKNNPNRILTGSKNLPLSRSPAFTPRGSNFYPRPI